MKTNAIYGILITAAFLISPLAKIWAGESIDHPRELVFSTLDDLYGSTELSLMNGSDTHFDKQGRRYVIKSGAENGGCLLIDITKSPKQVGSFATPSMEGDNCEYLGGSPRQKGKTSWIIAGPFGNYCAYQIDELKKSLANKTEPVCSFTLPVNSQYGGPPDVVGWLSNKHVILKTAYCCGSEFYNLVNLASGKIVGLGMSYESDRRNLKFPALRPWSHDRKDYWIVQRANESSAKSPSEVAVVHCSKLTHFLETGDGAVQTIQLKGQKFPFKLTIPNSKKPCPAGTGPW